MKKKTMKLGLKVYNIWPLNLASIIGKSGPSEMFIATEEEGVKMHTNEMQQKILSIVEMRVKLLLLLISHSPIIINGPCGLLLVVSHLFIVLVLVLWVRLEIGK